MSTNDFAKILKREKAAKTRRAKQEESDGSPTFDEMCLSINAQSAVEGNRTCVHFLSCDWLL
jgi:hypothetical protein